jgi:hypothetical protein
MSTRVKIANPKLVNPKPHKTDGKKRRKRRKGTQSMTSHDVHENREEEKDVMVEYVPQELDENELGEEFASIFHAFQARALPPSPPPDVEVEQEVAEEIVEEEEHEIGLSKTKAKKLGRMSVAELKGIVAKPDMVEVRPSLEEG